MAEPHPIEPRQIRARLCIRHDVVDGDFVDDGWHARILDDRATPAQHPKRIIEIDAHVAFEFFHGFAHDSESKSPDALLDVGDVIVDRFGARGGVERIVTGDDAEELRAFASGFGDDADLIETRRKRDETPAAYAAVARLESNDSAQRGGLPNRPTSFGT